jgi:hypothetical protein
MWIKYKVKGKIAVTIGQLFKLNINVAFARLLQDLVEII